MDEGRGRTAGHANAILLFADPIGREGLLNLRFGRKGEVETTGLRPGISVRLRAETAVLREFRWEESGAAVKVVIFGTLDHASVERFVASLAIS